jgi:glycosyltransferase involved in cell wall biosynthesis
MINVLFFTENNWAFGAIHRALCKRLFKYDINADILSWEQQYTDAEFLYMVEGHNYFSTTPESVPYLMRRGVPVDRLVVVVHGSESLQRIVAQYGTEVFENVFKFAVINQDLSVLCETLGIKRKPLLVKVGVDADYFYSAPAKELKTLGYAGAKQHLLKDGKDCKRAHLIEDVAKQTGLRLVCPSSKMSHMSMPGYYKSIDALLVASSEETAGLPAMEAAAASRLVISTEVGYFNAQAGVVCGMSDEQFVTDAINAIMNYKDHERYWKKCLESRAYAAATYDWKHTLKDWVQLFY